MLEIISEKRKATAAKKIVNSLLGVAAPVHLSMLTDYVEVLKLAHLYDLEALLDLATL